MNYGKSRILTAIMVELKDHRFGVFPLTFKIEF